jgi:hypothetical protein
MRLTFSVIVSFSASSPSFFLIGFLFHIWTFSFSQSISTIFLYSYLLPSWSFFLTIFVGISLMGILKPFVSCFSLQIRSRTHLSLFACFFYCFYQLVGLLFRNSTMFQRIWMIPEKKTFVCCLHMQPRFTGRKWSQGYVVFTPLSFCRRHDKRKTSNISQADQKRNEQ